jgi:hypothetical protein
MDWTKGGNFLPGPKKNMHFKYALNLFNRMKDLGHFHYLLVLNQ